MNSSVSTTVAVSSVCQNPCPACTWSVNMLSPGLEFSWLQNGFCFLLILTCGRTAAIARRNCYCLARNHFQRAFERVSVPERMEEGKEAKALFASLTNMGLCGQNGQYEAGVSRKSFENK